MQISSKGLALIERFEGNRLTAYRCPAGILTIGVGHTSAAGAPVVTAGMRISQAESMQILARDVRVFETAVARIVKVPVNQNQWDALISFAFNLGAAALGKSTLLKKLNGGDHSGAADEFLKWDKAGGRVLVGLTRRRAAERDLFRAP